MYRERAMPSNGAVVVGLDACSRVAQRGICAAAPSALVVELFGLSVLPIVIAYLGLRCLRPERAMFVEI